MSTKDKKSSLSKQFQKQLHDLVRALLVQVPPMHAGMTVVLVGFTDEHAEQHRAALHPLREAQPDEVALDLQRPHVPGAGGNQFLSLASHFVCSSSACASLGSCAIRVCSRLWPSASRATPSVSPTAPSSSGTVQSSDQSNETSRVSWSAATSASCPTRRPSSRATRTAARPSSRR